MPRPAAESSTLRIGQRFVAELEQAGPNSLEAAAVGIDRAHSRRQRREAEIVFEPGREVVLAPPETRACLHGVDVDRAAVHLEQRLAELVECPDLEAGRDLDDAGADEIERLSRH